jgi:hypothetical protein
MTNQEIEFEARQKLGRQLLEVIDGMEKSSFTPAEMVRHIKHEIRTRIKPVMPMDQSPEA